MHLAMPATGRPPRANPDDRWLTADSFPAEVRSLSQRRPRSLADHGPPSAFVFLLFVIAVAAISLVLPPVAQRLGSLVGGALGGVGEAGRPWLLFLLPAGILATVMLLALWSTRSRANDTGEPQSGRGLPPLG